MYGPVRTVLKEDGILVTRDSSCSISRKIGHKIPRAENTAKTAKSGGEHRRKEGETVDLHREEAGAEWTPIVPLRRCVFD